MVKQTIEIDGTEYQVDTDGDEPTIERTTPTAGEAIHRYVEDHPAIVEVTALPDEVEIGGRFSFHVNLVDGNPGNTNIGTGRTDAYKDHLEPLGLGIDVRCYEELNGRLSKDYDIEVAVTLVDSDSETSL